MTKINHSGLTDSWYFCLTIGGFLETQLMLENRHAAKSTINFSVVKLVPKSIEKLCMQNVQMYTYML